MSNANTTSALSVLPKYTPGPTMELELRFGTINKSMLAKLLNIKGTHVIEQTINLIKSMSPTKSAIITMSFIDGKKTSIEYSHKNIIDRADNITISNELPAKQFSPNNVDVARLKLRYTIIPDDLPDWKIDITLVKQIKDIKTELKSASAIMMAPVTAGVFLNLAPFNFADKIELEVEHIGKTRPTAEDVATITAIVSNRPPTTDLDKHIMIVAVALHFRKHPILANKFRYNKSLRSLYNNVIELNHSNYIRVVRKDISNFYVLDKADGVRTLIYILGDKMHALNDKHVEIALNPEMNSINKDRMSILDTELVNGIYYVFDVLMINGKSLLDSPTYVRVKSIAPLIKLSKLLVAKKMVRLSEEDYQSLLKQVWKAKKPYDVDGLIFTPVDSPYLTMRSWKWKPIEHLSIDFLVKNVSGNRNILFSSIDKRSFDKLHIRRIEGYYDIFRDTAISETYFPIQFSPSSNPNAYKYEHPKSSKFALEDIVDNICEFKLVDNKWVLMRIRTDKKPDLEAGLTFGNAHYVAEYIYQNYQNPLKFTDLLEAKAYFQEEKSKSYSAMTACNSFIKNTLISRHAGSEWLVDLAAGQGQDLFRVSGAGYTNALFIDIDTAALTELVNRKNDSRNPLNTRVYTKALDLNKPYADNLKAIEAINVPIGKINVVICNFAIHYMTHTKKSIDNIAMLISKLLAPGGRFIMTNFDGNRMFETLKSIKYMSTYDLYDGEVLKYSVRKQYKESKIAKFGQQIGVLLPFSGGEYYVESLVNIDYMITAFETVGLIKTDRQSFGTKLDAFRVENAKVYSALRDIDKEFISMYSWVAFEKSVSGGAPITHILDTIVFSTDATKKEYQTIYLLGNRNINIGDIITSEKENYSVRGINKQPSLIQFKLPISVMRILSGLILESDELEHGIIQVELALD